MIEEKPCSLRRSPRQSGLRWPDPGTPRTVVDLRPGEPGRVVHGGSYRQKDTFETGSTCTLYGYQFEYCTRGPVYTESQCSRRRSVGKTSAWGGGSVGVEGVGRSRVGVEGVGMEGNERAGKTYAGRGRVGVEGVYYYILLYEL